MLYKGVFRSLDQSVDEKGQQYEVRIFTGYDPNDLNATVIGESDRPTNVGPYPLTTKRIAVSATQRVTKYIPTNPISLTMTDHPFTVDYVGDTGNVHKPYRCSSATVSFLQENLNTDFINSMGNGVLVMLLKWKNEVYQSGNTMVNGVTGATLNKTTYSCYDFMYGDIRTYWSGFLPWKYDAFCYDVEWVGFATPEMLSVGYDHITDRFSLNCQDALSTLQYTEFNRTAQLSTMLNTLFKMLNTLGTYNDIYITNSVRFANDTSSVLPIRTYDPVTGNALKHMVHQQDNFLDEDDKPKKYFGVLEDMMEYMSLTIIPYKDQLWIVSAESLAQGHTVYNHYHLDGSSYRLWSLPAENATYSYVDDVDIVDTAFLDGNSFCGGTDLSSDIMYNKVKVICDEMRPAPLLPDWDDDAIIAPEPSGSNQPLSYNFWRMNYVNQSWQPDNYYYWEAYFMRPLDADNIKLYKYKYDTWKTMDWNETSSHITKSEISDDDLTVLFGQQIRTANGHPRPYYLKGVIWEEHNSTQYYPAHSNMGACAFIMDFFGTSVNSATTIPNVVNFTRKILLVGQYNASPYRKETAASEASGKNHDWDDKDTYWQPLVYMKSKPFLGNGKQWLNITGDWQFYYGSGGDYWSAADPNCTYWYPIPTAEFYGASNYALFYNQYAFVWAKVKCGKYYLKSSGFGNYTWDTVEGPTKLWFTRDQAESTPCTDKQYSFQDTTRGVEGISLELPVAEGYAEPMQIEMWFDRPLGPSNKACASATIENLAINIYSDEYVQSRKRRNPDRDNTEYSNEIISGAIEEMNDVGLIHSSCDTAGLSYSETALKKEKTAIFGISSTYYFTNPSIFNEGVGQYGLPEQVKVEALRNHGVTPTVAMKTNVFRKVLSPLSRVFWSWLNGKPMIVDSMNIDYEYEQCGVTLLETKEPSTTSQTIQRINRTRNYYRTRNIIFGGHIARREPVALTSTPVLAQSINVSNNEVVVWNTDNATGVSLLNVDWATGEFRLTAPVTGSISNASNTNGEVKLTI